MSLDFSRIVKAFVEALVTNMAFSSTLRKPPWDQRGDGEIMRAYCDKNMIVVVKSKIPIHIYIYVCMYIYIYDMYVYIYIYICCMNTIYILHKYHVHICIDIHMCMSYRNMKILSSYMTRVQVPYMARPNSTTCGPRMGLFINGKTHILMVTIAPIKNGDDLGMVYYYYCCFTHITHILGNLHIYTFVCCLIWFCFSLLLFISVFAEHRSISVFVPIRRDAETLLTADTRLRPTNTIGTVITLITMFIAILLFPDVTIW